MVWTYEVCFKGEHNPFKQVTVIGFESVKEMLEKQSGRTDVDIRVVKPKNAHQSELELLKALGIAIINSPSAEISRIPA